MRLATVVGDDIVSFAVQRFVLPLGYSNDQVEEEERTAAADALGTGAAWDPLAIALVAQMPPIVRARIKHALPASVVATSTLTPCDNAEAAQDDRGEHHVFDAATGITTRSDEAIESARAALATALEIVSELVPAPDVDPLSPTQLDELLADETLGLNLRTFVATAAVAQRQGLPIYSDDRAVRRYAAADSIPTFGTLALLDAASARGLLTQVEVTEVRRTLLARGSLGMRPTSGEVVELGKANGLACIGVQAVLTDHFAWLFGAYAQLSRIAALLRAVYDDAAESLRPWAAYYYGIAIQQVPSTVAGQLLASVLLGSVWAADSGSREDATFAIALFNALVEAPKALGTQPFRGLGVDTMVQMLTPFGPNERAFLFRRFLRLLPHSARVEAIMKLTAPSPPLP